METGQEMSTEKQSKVSLGWDELQGLKGKALEVLNHALTDGTPRDKMQAAMVVKGMDDSNIKVAEFNDKTARLDSGLPTEISDHATLGSAVADLAGRLGSILGDGAGATQQPLKVVERGEAPIRVIGGRTEPSDPDEETTVSP